MRIAVVVPAYREAQRLGVVLAAMPNEVTHVIVVDDGSDDATSRVALAWEDPRLELIRHRRNLGVGAAMRAGYARALERGAEVVVKVDGDGQMDPALLGRLVAPLAAGEADYAKGNRFTPSLVPPRMPLVRLVGNMGLTFLTKLASGYWSLFDPTNGYTALDARVLRRLRVDALATDYFFEISLLLELRRLGAVVRDVPIPAIYAGETSKLSPLRALLSFPPRLLLGLLRRLGRQYYTYDVSAASALLLAGLPLLAFGVGWGLWQWVVHAQAGVYASTGTVLLAVLPILLGVQCLGQALALDVRSVPSEPVGPRLDPATAPPVERTLAGYLGRHAHLLDPLPDEGVAP